MPLDNPYLGNPYGKTNTSLLDPSKPMFSTRPSVAVFGNTEVITTNPIITTNNPLSLPTKDFSKREKSQAQKDFESYLKLQANIKKDTTTDNSISEKPSWYSKKSKTQKLIFWSGVGVATLIVGYLIYKAVKKQ
jgi:hypothetical protein